MTEATVEIEPQPSWRLADAIAAYVVGIVGSVVVLGAYLALSGRAEPDLLGTALGLFALWGGLLGVPLVASRRAHRAGLRAQLGLIGRGRDVLWAVPLGVACQIVMVPLIYLPLRPFIDEDELSRPANELLSGVSGAGLVILATLLVVCAPVVEEVFFRGFLLRALVRRFGPVTATGGSAVIFGATHFQLLQFIALAAFGLVLAVLTVRTGRLGPAIWTHAAFNGTAAVVFLVTR